MKAILKAVGKPPEVIDIDNDLKALQEAVDGYIEVLGVGDNVLMICDEEGKLKGKPYNFDLGHDIIVGDVLFVKSSGEDFTDLDDVSANVVLNFFSRTPYTT